MGVFVFLPLVLPLTAWPIARLAEQHLHPRVATRLLTAVAGVMALCSTVCLGLLVVVGTAQLPGNPLPDGWSDPEVRAAVPYDEVAGKAAIPALLAVAAVCGRALWRHARVRRRAHRALAGLPDTEVAVLADERPYAYALPGGALDRVVGGTRDRVVVTTALLAGLRPAERRALFAHERAHLAARHHRFLLVVRLAACANPFLRPLRTAVSYAAERWADEEAARTVGDRRTVARAIAKAALASGGTPAPTLAGFAVRGEWDAGVAVRGERGADVPVRRERDGDVAVQGGRDADGVVRASAFAGFALPGPVPRRVAALLGPAPAPRTWPSLFTAVGVAAWTAAAGTAMSAMSSANSALTLALVLHAATPL